MNLFSKHDILQIAIERGVGLNPDWTGCGPVFPLLELMRQEGAVVVVKLDGQRTGPGARPYTVMVSGGALGDDFFRTDAASLDEGLCHVIGNYAASVWSACD